MGAALVDWAQRPPAPTALGLQVYEQALPVLQAVEDLAAMTKERVDPAGILGDTLPATAAIRSLSLFP